MLDLFLDAAYRQKVADTTKRAKINALRTLPNNLLAKLASGEIKLGYGSGPECSEGGDHVLTWLDRFKGTPLFEQALSLEQQMLSVDMAQAQHQAQERERRKEDEAANGGVDFYEQKDQIRLQKKLLDLQLEQEELASQATTAAVGKPVVPPPVPEAGAQGAGAVPPEVQTGSVDAKTAGEILAKQALALPDMGAMRGMAGGALNAAKGAFGKLAPGVQKGVLLGAGGGAIGGAVANAHDDQGFHPIKAIGGALKGAVTGGAVGGLGAAAAGRLSSPKA